MVRSAFAWLVLCSVGVLTVGTAISLGAERSAIADKYKWKLTDIFPTPAAADAARARLVQEIPTFSRFEGHLGDSAPALLAALDALMDTDLRLSRLLNYSSMQADEDTRASRNLELRQNVEQLAVQFGAATAFVRPEILQIEPAKIEAFLKAEPKLAPYRPMLDDILRRKPHTLSPAEEKIVAESAMMAGAGDALHGIFTNAELPYPEVTLSTGEKVRLDAAAYTKYRASANKADRDLVFKAFWGTYQNFRLSMATALYAQVKAHVFDRNVHKFGSSLETSLFNYNIPTKVYTQLLADVHANLPTLHRYLKLRQRMLKLGTLQYQDLYVPLVTATDLKFTPEQAMEVVGKATAPLGDEYVKTLLHGYQNGWVDWLPSTGKRSGAYSTSAYDVHPFQLQNFMGEYDDVSTLAHESGHSMHSWYSNKHQPYVSHDYAIFVAEVASTLNENLLVHYMLDHSKDDATRLSLLGSFLDNLRQTLFRQTLFAEFELKIHEMAERGESLTGDNLNQLYLGLVREYYGHDKGVCLVDDLYAVEWAYIPHFYWNFYVYQYATSLVASTSLAGGIREEAARTPAGTAARDAYLRMLSSGSSKYPIDLLKDAGVDMTTSAPFAAAMKEMNRVMDEMEKILDRKK